MKAPNDGGPAWPHNVNIQCPDVEQAVEAFGSNYEGMSLRDWFAGMALQGLIGADNNPETLSEPWLAAKAYAAADAMIQQREKGWV